MSIATINGIPVYDAVIADAETGMFRISLVDCPAVITGFQAFDENRKPVLFAIENEEKRLIRGCVMRADFPIYRCNPEMGEFFLMFKPEQIRVMAEKYLAESRQNLVNLMHQAGTDVDGVQMVQYFIKGDGVSVTGFDECADGSLFAEFHILNDALWDEIKKGTFKGFSLEGIFDHVPQQEQEKENKFSKLFKKIDNMSKVNRFKAALAKFLQEFGNVTTDKGILSWEGDDDIKVGDAVSIVDEDGNSTPAEDGEYTTSENQVIVVADGVVAEIKDVEVVVEPETPVVEEQPQEAEGETPAEEMPSEPETPAEDEKDALIKELEQKVADLEAENAALKEKVAEMQKMSAAKPAHQEAESFQVAPTGIKGLDRLARIATAK